ncbi:hypothetical protein FO519_006743 [Halicephalobus sp. NKZ332]|nr:hypothetical protein FO519_006743 [Halicephalobus sp. NKZ332]
MAEEREIDKEYLTKLESRLQHIKDQKSRNINSKEIIDNLAGRKELQFSNLITGKDDLKFEDNFVDKPIQSTWIQKKVLPQTVAISSGEILPLVKHDHLETKKDGEEGRVGADNVQPDPVLDLDIELMSFLKEEKAALKDGSIELVASDTALPIGQSSDGEFYLATCWVVYDDYYVPDRYFAAFYKIDSVKNEAELWQKFPISNAPTFCRLTKTSPIATDELYWLIFSHSKGVQAFSIDSNTKNIEPLDQIGDVFPVLEIGTLPGSAIRSHCWIARGFRFSVVGFDTGYVVASVCTMNSGTIIDRKTIKFSGPISVLKLIDTNEDQLETAVLVSSTIGPVVVWNLGLVDEYLQWNLKAELVGSENFDSIISGNTNHEFIFIGTYAEQILIYDLDAVVTKKSPSSPIIQIPIVSQISVGSPVLSINYVPADDSVIVLSYKGFHKFIQPRGRPLDSLIKADEAVDAPLAEATAKLDLKIAPLN